jgi:hypothetical protein
VSSNEPDTCGCQIDSGEEVASGFVIACGDCAELFEFGKEVLDQVSCFVEFFVKGALLFAIDFGRDDGAFARLLERLQYAHIGVEALVGDHRAGFDLRQQDIGPVQFAGLTFGQVQGGRIAQRIHRGVDLGAQTAFAAAEGLPGAPFLRAPALCWWARTMVASIMAYSLSASLAR